jgi:glycosyltransferase involved in cell wall biosynthesis
VAVHVLMVSAYPPVRDGIANYAVQEVKDLRASGHDVEVLSPQPSAAHHHLDLRSRRGKLALAKRLHNYDRVVIQYHPDLFYPSPLTPRDREITTAGLLVAFKCARELEVRVHEVNYDWGRESGRHGRMFRALWRMPDQVLVHTEPERDMFVDAFGRDDVKLVDHGEHFIRRTAIDKLEARARLGIDSEQFLFLSIGFIQPHKGFDRAIRAFGALDVPACRLDVVGSLRVEDPGYVAYANELQRLVDETPNAHLHLEYVSDAAFDEWVVASDYLVLPYRHIWSSGVLERAALYDRPVIVTGVGGIPSQAPSGTVVVADDHELLTGMRRVTGRGTAKDRSEWSAQNGPLDHDAAMAAIRRAAAVDRMRAPARFEEVELGSGQTLRAPRAGSDQRGDDPHAASLSSLPHLVQPPPRGRSALGSVGKRLTQRLTYWQIQPIIDHVNRLHDLVERSTERANGPEDAPG